MEKFEAERGPMGRKSKASMIKSWLCIIALTFVVPAAAGRLGNQLLSSVAQIADEARPAATHKIVQSERAPLACHDEELTHSL